MQARAVTAADVPGVVALITDVLAEFGLVFGAGSRTDDEVRELPDSYRAGAFWVAVEGDELLGTCAMMPVGEGTVELRKMYLRPAARGRGVGKLLLETAVTWARAAGARKIVLDTTEQMKRAIAFYEGHGFVRDDTQIRGARCSRGYVREL